MKSSSVTAFNLFLLVAATAGLYGCGMLKDTVYLQNLSMEGPIAQPPIHLTDHPQARDVHLIPRISCSGNQSLTTRIAGTSYGSPVIGEGTNNFQWSMAFTQVGLDLDWMVSEYIALDAGVNFSGTQGADLWGGNIGIGFPFTGETVGGRFDLGLQWQSLFYDAYSVVVKEYTPFFSSSTQTEVIYFHDVDRSSPLGFYGSFTLNSRSSGILNGFGSLCVSHQKLVSFQPTHSEINGIFYVYEYTDARAEQSATFVILTPGLSFSISQTMKLVTGVRLISEFGMGSEAELFVAPMLQMDITL